MDDQDATEDRIAALEATVAAMAERIGAQERELVELRSSPRWVASERGDSVAPQPPGDAAVDRRTALRRAGAVAAAAGGALVLGPATPAAAGNGDALEVGSTVVQDVAAGTTLLYEPTTGGGTFNAFTVRAEFSDVSSYPAMVAGWARAGRPIANGVYGYSESPTGAGIVAVGVGVGTRTKGNRAALALEPRSAMAPPDRSDVHTAGEIDVDVNGGLWSCVAGGTPGVWRRLAAPSTVGALTLWDAPRRSYDSRAGQAPAGVEKGALAPGTNRTIDLTVGGGVPDGAVAALCNVTVVNTSPAGWLKVFKAGAPVPSGTNLNWFQSGSVVANATTVALDGGTCTLRTGSGPADVVVDVVGYYL